MTIGQDPQPSDPALRWADWANGTDNSQAAPGEAVHPGVIPVEEGGERPVGTPESIQTSLPATPDALTTDSSGQPVGLIATSGEITPPDGPTLPADKRPRFTRRRALGAAAAVVVLGGGIGGIIVASQGGGSGKQGPKSHAANAGPKPGQVTANLSAGPGTVIEPVGSGKNASPSPTDITPSSPVESVPVSYPDLVSGVASPVGNIQPSYLEPYAQGGRSTTIEWNGSEEPINTLPESSDPNLMADGILNMFSALRTLNPGSADWQKLAQAFSINPEMPGRLQQWNANFQAQRPADAGNARDQEIFFDTVDNKATFTHTGTDSAGNEVYSLTGGKLYERRLRIGAKGNGDANPYDFGDPQAYVVNESRVVSEFTFHVHFLPNGSFTVIDVDFNIG